jgi:hypothetical protein
MFYINQYKSMMRALNEATAYRKDGIVYIFMIGEIPTPCDEVKVIGKYPGNIMHVADPGTAELFVKIGRKPENEGKYCIEMVIPFFIEEEIQDLSHDKVTIYVNNDMYKRIIIEEKFDGQC